METKSHTYLICFLGRKDFKSNLNPPPIQALIVALVHKAKMVHRLPCPCFMGLWADFSPF